jgi:hypothetical protein
VTGSSYIGSKLKSSIRHYIRKNILEIKKRIQFNKFIVSPGELIAKHQKKQLKVIGNKNRKELRTAKTKKIKEFVGFNDYEIKTLEYILPTPQQDADEYIRSFNKVLKT